MPAIEGKYANKRAKEERTPANGAETGLERASKRTSIWLARSSSRERQRASFGHALCLLYSIMNLLPKKRDIGAE